MSNHTEKLSSLNIELIEEHVADIEDTKWRIDLLESLEKKNFSDNDFEVLERCFSYLDNKLIRLNAELKTLR